MTTHMKYTRLVALVDEAIEDEGLNLYDVPPDAFDSVVESLLADLGEGVDFDDLNPRRYVRDWATENRVTQEER